MFLSEPCRLHTTVARAGRETLAAASYRGARDDGLTAMSFQGHKGACLAQMIVVVQWKPERAVRRIELVRSRGEIKEARNKKLCIG